MGPTEGHRHRELAPNADGARDLDVTPVQGNELRDESQPDPAALGRTALCMLDSVETIENTGQVGVRDSDASVGDTQHCRFSHASHRDLDCSLQRELERVRQQVENDAFPHVGIDIDNVGELVAIDDEMQTGAIDRLLERASEFRSQRSERHRLVCNSDPPGLETGEVEQRVHELGQAHAVAMHDLDLGREVRGAPSLTARLSSPTGPMIRVSGVRNS